MPRAKTNPALDRFADIASAFAAQVPANSKRVMVWADLERGVTSVSVFIEVPRRKKLIWQDGSAELKKAVESLWASCRRRREPWRIFVLAVDGAELRPTFLPEVSGDDSLLDLRDRAVEEFFGHTKVDYSAAGL